MKRSPRNLDDTETSPNKNPFPYKDYLDAKSALLDALPKEPFYAVVTGHSGTGKTSLMRDIAKDLDRLRHHIVYLPPAKASITGIVRLLARILHVGQRGSHIETICALADAIRAHGVHILLWLDEAHELPPQTLRNVRNVAEADGAQQPLLSVVLSGLPDLSLRLDEPLFFPLKRRCTQRYILSGLKRDELDPFLVHRFGTLDAARLPDSPKDEIFEKTQAIPALIDLVVKTALYQTKGEIDAELIRSILDKYACYS